MMAGNISDGQGISDVVLAIEELKKYQDIYWIFVGGGAMLEWLKGYVKEASLENNVFVLGRYPFEYMSAFYTAADIMLLTLKKSICPHLNATIPARVQSYLSAGKPIVGMAGEGVQALVNGYKCGAIVPSGDYVSLAHNILMFYKDRQKIEEMGDNSRKLFKEHYTRNVCMEHLMEIIK